MKNGRPERERKKGATCTAGTAAGEATGERAGEGADGMEGEAGESHEKLSEEGTAVTVKIREREKECVYVPFRSGRSPFAFPNSACHFS